MNASTIDDSLTAAFRAAAGLGAGVKIIGGWSGQLSNGGESLRLYKPGPPEGTNVPAYQVERVDYDRIERIVVNGSFGNDHFAVDDTAAEVTLNGERRDLSGLQPGQEFILFLPGGGR